MRGQYVREIFSHGAESTGRVGHSDFEVVEAAEDVVKELHYYG